MKNYYYLATILPKLEIGEKPDITYQEFVTLLKENLTKSDYDKTRRLRWLYDLRNIRAYWKGEPLDYWGNLNDVELEDVLLTREGGELPDYLYKFLDEHESREDRKKYFPQVLTEYFANEARESSGFLRKFRSFERKMRLVITAYRARQLGRDLSVELQYEDPEDDIVAQLLAQKDAKTFEPPQDFEDLKRILDHNYGSPLELQKAIMQYIFDWIEDELTFDVFSINRILGYMVQFILVERTAKQDKEKGLKILDNIVKEIS